MMPEAFSSIADMRVVIDSSTEKLDAGLSAAKNLVARFASEGSSSLSLFDRAVGRTADGIEALRSRAGIILASIEYALDIYKTIEPYLEKAAQETGTQQQLDQTKRAAVGLGSALYDTLGTAYGWVSDKTKDATASVLGYSDAMRESSKAQATNIDAAYLNSYFLEKMTEHLKDATVWLRSFSAPEKQSWDTLAYSIEKAEKKLESIKEKLAHPERGQSFLDWLFGSDLELQKRTTEFDLLVDRMLLNAEKFAAVASWKTTVDTSDQDSFLEKLEKQVSGLELRAQTVGMNSVAAAEYIHKAEIMNELDEKNIGLTQEQKDELDGLISRWNKATEAIDGNTEAKRRQQEIERQNRTAQSAINALQRDVANERLRAGAIGQSTAATQAQAAEERALMAIRQSGREPNEMEISQIRALGQARREATEQLLEQQQQLRMIGEIGNAVTSNLDSAFRRWANGSKVTVKDMAASILADLAEIQFKAAVLNPLANFLSGSQSGGGGILGSLFGLGGGSSSSSSWITSVIPAFADGGDFAGGPMIVGEEGPELIWPKFPGRVIPNNALPPAAAASGPPVINMPVTINAQGAYPESIADIKAAIAETQASIPQTAVAAYQEARDRGVV